jgi:hypothetical protein
MFKLGYAILLAVCGAVLVHIGIIFLIPRLSDTKMLTQLETLASYSLVPRHRKPCPVLIRFFAIAFVFMIWQKARFNSCQQAMCRFFPHHFYLEMAMFYSRLQIAKLSIAL